MNSGIKYNHVSSVCIYLCLIKISLDLSMKRTAKCNFTDYFASARLFISTGKPVIMLYHYTLLWLFKKSLCWCFSYNIINVATRQLSQLTKRCPPRKQVMMYERVKHHVEYSFMLDSFLRPGWIINCYLFQFSVAVLLSSGKKNAWQGWGKDGLV